MSPSVYLVQRDTKTGKRWHVRYRLGGRYAPVHHAGAFKTQKEARARRDLIAGEIAAGRDPRKALAAIAAPAGAPHTFSEDTDRWLTGRAPLVAAATLATNTYRARTLTTLIGHRPTSQLTRAELQADVVAELAEQLAPTTLHGTIAVLRMILDNAEITPNPAAGLKLPRIIDGDYDPPDSASVLRVLETIRPASYRIPLLLLEQTGMRIGEAYKATWADLDPETARIRLRAHTTKSRRARWIQLPAWLLQALLQSCPPDDRVAARPLLYGTVGGLQKALERACASAGVPEFSPHELRHRRLSLWHGQGVPARELAHRAGHARASTTLDVYSHVMPLDEIDERQMRRLVTAERNPR